MPEFADRTHVVEHDGRHEGQRNLPSSAFSFQLQLDAQRSFGALLGVHQVDAGTEGALGHMKAKKEQSF